MKRIIYFLTSAGLLYSLEIGGEAKINNFYYIFPDSIKTVPYMFHQFEINFSDATENYDFNGSLLFRLWIQNNAFTLSELSTPSFKVKPHIWELYLTIYGFIFKNIDLKIGKQRISWGTADRLNPTDILNPYDLQNPFDFGKKIPSEAILLDLYLPGEFTIEGIFIPRFTPPLMPEGNFPLLTNQYSYFFEGIKDTIIYPESKNFKNSMFAGKFHGKMLKWDFSLSYFYGFDNFSLIKNIITYMDTLGYPQTIIEYFFPRIQMIGFDFAGEIKSVGIWGEMGYFIPVDTVNLPFPLPSYLIPQKFKNPYLKSTLGFDYTFKKGIYMNFQWNHGFFFERGDELHEYFVARIEKKFFRDRLKIGIAGIGEVAEKEHGNAFIPEISYKPHDNVEISTGLITLDGTSGSLLGSWKNFDQIYLNLKVEF